MKKGFTLIELIIVMAIFSLLIYLTSTSFIQIQKSRFLNDNVWQISVILRQAQNKAISGKSIAGDHLRFGVLFSENYYQEFATLTDFANRDESYDLITNLPLKLHFIDFNLPDICLQSNDCIIFSSIEGISLANGSISLENKVDEKKKKISINQEGKVSF